MTDPVWIENIGARGFERRTSAAEAPGTQCTRQLAPVRTRALFRRGTRLDEHNPAPAGVTGPAVPVRRGGLGERVRLLHRHAQPTASRIELVTDRPRAAYLVHARVPG